MITIHAVGDVAPRRADVAAMLAPAASALAGGDILFGQMECPLSRRGTAAAGARLPMRSDPDVAPILADAGFAVMSVAGNHALDFGAEALADTREALAASGIRTCGAGPTLADAWAPAILGADGRRVAFLAACSVLPPGYAAEPHRPGCAPIRAYTHYYPTEPDQPGTPARILTFTDRNDLSLMCNAVRQARRAADVVVLSLHWGVHFTRALIADYQVEVAHAAIDAGADLILGHHPHLLKGVGFHRGKPILYSMGNFAIEQPSVFREDVQRDAAFATVSALGSDWAPSARYMLPDETRHTVVARAEITPDGRIGLRLQPCRIDDDSVPHPVPAGSPEGVAFADYLAAITQEAGLGTRYRWAGDWLCAEQADP